MTDWCDGKVFCIPETTPIVLCLDPALVAVMNQLEAESVAADEEPTSITELAVDAICDHLRAVGRLPKPYV